MYRVSRHFAYAAVIGLGIIPATAARAEDEDRNDFVQTNLFRTSRGWRRSPIASSSTPGACRRAL